MSVYEIKRAYQKKEENMISFYEQAVSEGSELEWLVEVAADFSDIEALEFLIDKGFNPTDVNSSEWNILHICAARKESSRGYEIEENRVYNATKKMLELRVSPMKKTPDNKTCYHYAAYSGNFEFIKALIDNGTKLTMTDNQSNNALHIAVDAARHAISSLEYAEKSVQDGIKAYEAAKVNFTEDTSQAYIDTFTNRIKDNEKRLKAEQNRVSEFEKTIQELLKTEIDLEDKNSSQETPLSIAVKYGLKRISAMLEGIDIDNNSDSVVAAGMTFHKAAELKDYEAMKALFNLGHDINQLNDTAGEFLGRTPLAIAMLKMDKLGVEQLLELGADPNLKDSDGRQAIAYLFTVTAQLCVNQNTFKDKVGQSIINSLIQHGWDKNSFVDDDSNTTMILACRSAGPATGYNSNFFPAVIIEELAYKGVDLDLANLSGINGLMYLCSGDPSRTENSLITLLEQGARVDMKDKEGRTALMYAAQNHYHIQMKNFAEMMDQFGDILVNTVDNQGKTALDYATEQDNEPLVKWLLMKL